jgi:hypothetical protein
MKKYEVTIEASITRTFVVEAEDEDAAYNLAHEQDFFTEDAIQSASWQTTNVNVVSTKEVAK